MHQKDSNRFNKRRTSVVFQVCQSVPQSPGVCRRCSTAPVVVMAPAFTAVSVTFTSTGNSRTLAPGWDQGPEEKSLGVHRRATDSGWGTGWSPAASPARLEPVCRVTATLQAIVASPAPATPAGRERCVTSK